jgi:hypothetical protein
MDTVRPAGAPPPSYCPRRLAKNLAALAAVDRELARRIEWPVASDHVVFGADGSAHLVRRRTPLRLDLQAVEIPVATDAAPGRIFGIGLGELVEHALARDPARAWWAYERDPWLLRLFLMRVDVARELRSRRLRLALGVDVLRAPGTGSGPTIVHPVLGGIYEHELAAMLGSGDGEVAFVAEGGLFVDQVARALARRGYRPLILDVERVAEDELVRAARVAQARLLFAINHTHGLAEFAQANGLTLVCWEVDPALDRLRPLAIAAPNAHVFTWREAHVEAFRAAGFEHVRHLPLAADVASRRPLSLDRSERERYEAPVVFVGSSMVKEAAERRAEFLASCAEVRGPALAAKAEAWLEALLDRQRVRGSGYLLDGWIERAFPDVIANARASGDRADPLRWVAEIAASERRLVALGALGGRGLHVWGDAGWSVLAPFGVRYRGPAGHRDELTRIYNGSGVHVDLGRAYQSDIVTMRVFDVLACGGFCVAEHSDELARLFDVGVEIESHRGFTDLVEKVDRWLADPAGRRRMAERGSAAVRARHTLDLRLDAMLSEALGRVAAIGAAA